MAISNTLVKRPALYKGERGLFPSTPMAEDDLRLTADGEEVVIKYYSKRNVEALKRLWAMVYYAWQNSDRWISKEEAMKDLKLRIVFTKVTYKDGELGLKPRSLKRISDEELRSVTRSIEDILLAEVLPGMPHNQWRDNLEEMLGVRR